MSGIYIKGFQLPEKNDLYCVKVECEPGKNPVASIWRKDVLGSMSFGAFECIPVPDHGRLGDLDELEQAMRNRKNYIGRLSDPDCLVADAPTIIPADKEEEQNVD